MGNEDPGVTRVVVGGVSGWAGSALSRGVASAPDLELVGGLSRSSAGRAIGDILGDVSPAFDVTGTVQEALSSAPDVYVEYTNPSAALGNIRAALDSGIHVVVGTSGLTDEDYSEIDHMAKETGLGVLACGNFSITAVLMMKFSEEAAKWVKSWEVIDYASAGKVDSPSGTARELANRLAAVGVAEKLVSLDETNGEKEARGADFGGTQVHSVRLPSFVISIESVFGQEDERLSLRHDSGTSAIPYVAGGLLAIRKVGGLVGVHRGLDSVMDLA
ncbi:MAG TPA: 4-hydroxy-tetrahydrodipicolinate reductase [Acidimicrobiia bacterium]